MRVHEMAGAQRLCKDNAPLQCRDESRHGTQECVRYGLS
jgi:hypothetical protein